MMLRLTPLCALLFVLALPCEAQEIEQPDSLAILQHKVEQLQVQLEQLSGLVLRLESRLLIQEQRTARNVPEGNHSHRPMEISNLDNEVVRIVRSRCSLTKMGDTVTLTCR
jgi:hypothetical protein